MKNTDHIRKIVKIHNRYYDVTNFNHPGGPIAIMAANRRDATALFESHHPFSDRTMMNDILKKYEMHEEREKCENYLLPGEKENGDLFDWEETLKSDFTTEVRDKVKKHFTDKALQRGVTFNEATKATPIRWCEWGFFLSASFWSFYTMLYSQSIFWSWLHMFICPTLYWMSGGMFHDGGHFAISRDWRINLGMQYFYRVISSPYDWLHEHIIGHHPYTNIYNKDPDLNQSNGEIRITGKEIWNKKHEGQENKFLIISNFLLHGLNIKNSLMLLATHKYNGCVYKMPTDIRYSLIHFFGIFLYGYVFYVLPFQIWTPFYAIKHVIIPYIIGSSIFALNSTINHFQKYTINGRNKNWYIHQVETSNNFGSYFPHYFLSLGLNYQIEHHLFPNVNHCHLVDIQPIVKSLCEKHGIRYNHNSGYKEALTFVYDHIREMGKKPVELQN